MSDESFTATFTVDRTPGEVFGAITDVRGWWSGEIDGRTDALGEVFTYRYRDVHYSKQRITELVPGRTVVWHVEEGYLDFVADTSEWTGTDIRFDIAPQEGGTEVRFTHVGLDPDAQCFDGCSSAWSFYINGSLQQLITTGQGEPNDHATKGREAVPDTTAPDGAAVRGRHGRNGLRDRRGHLDRGGHHDGTRRSR